MEQWVLSPEAYWNLTSWWNDPETQAYWLQDNDGSETYAALSAYGYLPGINEWDFRAHIWPVVKTYGFSALQDNGWIQIEEQEKPPGSIDAPTPTEIDTVTGNDPVASQRVLGCMDPNATNYNPNATVT